MLTDDVAIMKALVKNLISQFNKETNCFTQPLFFQQDEEILEKTFKTFKWIPFPDTV